MSIASRVAPWPLDILSLQLLHRESHSTTPVFVLALSLLSAVGGHRLEGRVAGLQAYFDRVQWVPAPRHSRPRAHGRGHGAKEGKHDERQAWQYYPTGLLSARQDISVSFSFALFFFICCEFLSFSYFLFVLCSGHSETGGRSLPDYGLQRAAHRAASKLGQRPRRAAAPLERRRRRHEVFL